MLFSFLSPSQVSWALVSASLVAEITSKGVLIPFTSKMVYVPLFPRILCLSSHFPQFKISHVPLLPKTPCEGYLIMMMIIIINYFLYASDVHTYNSRYASKSNFYKARFRTNIGKTMLSTLEADHWQKLPHDIKKLNLFIFSRKAKLGIELIRLKWVHYKQLAT